MNMRQYNQNKPINTDRIGDIERYGTAISFILFPVFFIIANLLHPNLLQIQILTDGKAWIDHFHGQGQLHFAHVLEFLSGPLLIIMAIHYMRVLRNKSPWLSFIGGVMAITGALMLVGNKSALCLTISAFDTLPENQLYQLTPGLNVMLQKEGWMIILWLLPLLPIGFLIQGIALYQSRFIPRWQSILIVIGSLLLANPEIEIVNLIASCLLLISFIPYARKMLKEN